MKLTEIDRWFNIVKWNRKCQMIIIVPGDRFFDCFTRLIIDQISIGIISQTAQIFKNSKLNTTKIRLFEQLKQIEFKIDCVVVLGSNLDDHQRSTMSSWKPHDSWIYCIGKSLTVRFLSQIKRQMFVLIVRTIFGHEK